jgi:hypothetical protein
VRATLALQPLGAIAASACAALAIVAAVLTKGPVGLFPLAIPPLALLLTGRERQDLARVAIVWVTLLAVTALLASMIIAIPDARHALAEFARTHVVPALQGERGLPRRSFDIARHFTLGILARMGALAALLWLIRPRGRDVRGIRWSVASFFFATGLIASLPLLASPVLAGHYFIPSVPFFALAVASIALPAVEAYRQRTSGSMRVVPVSMAALLVVLSLGVLLIRGPMEKRDVDLVTAVRTVGAAVPAGATIGTCASAAEDWGQHGYFQRFHRISLAPTDGPDAGFMVVRRLACAPPPGCVRAVDGGELILYRCSQQARPQSPLREELRSGPTQIAGER